MQHIWNGCEYIMHFSPFLPIIGALVKVLNPVWHVDEQTICSQDTAHRLPISFFLSFSFDKKIIKDPPKGVKGRGGYLFFTEILNETK